MKKKKRTPGARSLSPPLFLSLSRPRSLCFSPSLPLSFFIFLTPSLFLSPTPFAHEDQVQRESSIEREREREREREGKKQKRPAFACESLELAHALTLNPEP